MYFSEQELSQVLFNAEFTVWQHWASRRTQPRPRAAALIALARSARRRVAGCRLAAGRGAFCGQRLASRRGPFPFVLLFFAAHSTSSCCCTWPPRPFGDPALIVVVAV